MSCCLAVRLAPSSQLVKASRAREEEEEGSGGGSEEEEEEVEDRKTRLTAKELLSLEEPRDPFPLM